MIPPAHSSEPHKILFPTEFGALSAKASKTALLMAEMLDAELVVMHAVDLPRGLNRLLNPVDEKAARQKVAAQLEQYAQRLRAERNGVPVSIMVREGAPDHAIVKSGRDIDASLIVFGTKGGEGLRDTLLGSAVNFVIRHAHCPVLTIRNKPEKLGFTRILVQLETLREAPEQVVQSVRMAKLFNSELHFLGLVTGDPEHNRQLDASVRKAVRYAREQGLEDVEMHLEPLDHATEDEIEEYAHHIGADLICVLTQSDDEKGVKTLLRGSVADRVVNMSQFPVLSVTPEHA